MNGAKLLEVDNVLLGELVSGYLLRKIMVSSWLDLRHRVRRAARRFDWLLSYGAQCDPHCFDVMTE